MSKTYIDKATVLIIDDTPENLKVLSSALSNLGWEILVATDGEIGIEQAKYARPDLILLDVLMQGIDGFETCNILKTEPITQDIPIIFMTALDDQIDRVKGIALGAVDYITKPFWTEEVIARIKVHLKLRFVMRQLEKQKDQLEKRVEERTAELSQTLQTLQESQLHLVQSEKLSALGQLVAGVAHEMNNPIGFILGNLDYASDYIQDLIKHLQLYQQKYPEPDPEITANAAKIELEYLIKDLPELITSMQAGTERIRNISNSLRIFSRSDNAEKVPFNIQEGIDSTLLILKHRLKATEQHPEIEIIQENDSSLPEVSCYPGQLSQVFMNIIANAVDAIEEGNEGRSFTEIETNPGMIKISTSLLEDNSGVAIRIRDNGPGMSEEVKQRIFDYSFTTKAVGKGTGLGLAISRQIIEEKHGGKLTCNSVLGEGTEFAIELPIE